MPGWHHWLDGHEFDQTLRDSEGQGSLASCSPWSHKASNMTKWLSNKCTALLWEHSPPLAIFSHIQYITESLHTQEFTSVNLWFHTLLILLLLSFLKCFLRGSAACSTGHARPEIHPGDLQVMPFLVLAQWEGRVNHKRRHTELMLSVSPHQFPLSQIPRLPSAPLTSTRQGRCDGRKSAQKEAAA